MLFGKKLYTALLLCAVAVAAGSGGTGDSSVDHVETCTEEVESHLTGDEVLVKIPKGLENGLDGLENGLDTEKDNSKGVQTNEKTQPEKPKKGNRTVFFRYSINNIIFVYGFILGTNFGCRFLN